MATNPKGTEDRLSALIESKLSDMERRQAEGDPPSLADLNAAKRLIDWVEAERMATEAREITKG